MTYGLCLQTHHFEAVRTIKSVMELLVFLLISVQPGNMLSSSLYSDIIADHDDLCTVRTSKCELGDKGNYTSLASCCGFCQCFDRNCDQYGTCCLSKYGSIEAAQDSIEQTLYKCVDPNVYEYDESRSYNPQGYQFISTCNASYPNPTIRSLCETPDPDTYLETLYPVTDYTFLRTYRNQFCALCDDNADLKKVVRWEINVSCNAFDAITHEQMVLIIKKRQCNITFKAPEKKKVQGCIPYTISTCNVTGQWRVYNETLKTACNSFVDPYNYTYKNVFCYLCNTDDSDHVDQRRCPKIKMKLGSVSGYTPPFLAIMDLNAVSKYQTNENLQCNKATQFTDNKLGVCRDIQCDRSQYLSYQGTCDTNRRYQNPECYLAFFNFTPYDFQLSISRLNFIVPYLDQSVNSTDFEMSYKESDTKSGIVEYYIIKYLTNSVEQTKETLSMLRNRVHVFGFDVNVELVSYDSPIFTLLNGESSSDLPDKTILVKVATSFPKDTEGCINKDIINVDYLLLCPFVELKSEELHMEVVNGELFFLDNINISIPTMNFRQENGNIFVCLTDYERIYERLPEINSKKKEIAARFLGETSAKNLLSFLCVCASMGSLLITIAMVTITPTLHSHPGLNTLILCVFLLLAQSLYQFGVGQVSLPKWACSMIGALCHLLWLCVMAAMHVCSIDMFLIFRKMEPLSFESLPSKVFKRICYIVTLSLSFVILNIIVSLSTSGGKDNGYGGIICYISSSLMQIVTFVIPSILAIVSNIALFVFVAVHIKRSSIQNAGLKQERNYFGIYARLSTLTGFTWIVGFLLIVLPNEVLEYMFILLNASQGVFVMVAFIFNKRVWKSCCGKRKLVETSSTRSTRSMRISRGSSRITSVSD